MNVTQTTCSPPLTSAYPQDVGLKRKLQYEITQIQSSIQEAKSEDDEFSENDLTIEIEEWVSGFEQALFRAIEPEKVLHRFTTLLQEILQGPVLQKSLDESLEGRQFPLEEKSFLVNDQVCGEKILCICISMMKPEYAGQSPFSLNQPEPLTVKRHPIAEAAVAWLKKHDALLPLDSTIEEQYESLERSKLTSKKSTLDYLIYKMRLDALKKNREASTEAARKSSGLSGEEENEIRRHVADRCEHLFAGVLPKIKEINERSKAGIDEVKERDAKHINEVKAQLEQLQRDIQVLNGRIDNLQDQIKEVDESLSQVEKDATQLKNEATELEVAIEKAKQAAKKRKKKKLIRTLRQIAQVAAVAVTVHIVGPAVAAAL